MVKKRIPSSGTYRSKPSLNRECLKKGCICLSLRSQAPFTELLSPHPKSQLNSHLRQCCLLKGFCYHPSPCRTSEFKEVSALEVDFAIFINKNCRKIHALKRKKVIIIHVPQTYYWGKNERGKTVQWNQQLFSELNTEESDKKWIQGNRNVYYLGTVLKLCNSPVQLMRWRQLPWEAIPKFGIISPSLGDQTENKVFPDRFYLLKGTEHKPVQNIHRKEQGR